MKLDGHIGISTCKKRRSRLCTALLKYFPRLDKNFQLVDNSENQELKEIEFLFKISRSVVFLKNQPIMGNL